MVNRNATWAAYWLDIDTPMQSTVAPAPRISAPWAVAARRWGWRRDGGGAAAGGRMCADLGYTCICPTRCVRRLGASLGDTLVSRQTVPLTRSYHIFTIHANDPNHDPQRARACLLAAFVR